MTSPSVKPVHMDRLPLPVTISSIKSKVLDGDHFLIGKKAFTKVLCAGRVVSSRHVRSLGAMEYVVADPMPGDNVAKDISVLYRDELNDATNPAEQFPRSTLVLIPGKLVRFKGAIAIHAYSMRELICPDEYECLRMEAFLALQYHTKIHPVRLLYDVNHHPAVRLLLLVAQFRRLRRQRRCPENAQLRQ